MNLINTKNKPIIPTILAITGCAATKPVTAPAPAATVLAAAIVPVLKALPAAPKIVPKDIKSSLL